MQHRFRFLALKETNAKLWRIEGEEFFHLKKVLRLKVGDEVEVFNLDGIWGVGSLLDIQKDHAHVEVLKIQTESLLHPKLAIAIGALQQQTMSDLLPCLVELGLNEIHIFLQEGSSSTRLNEKTLARWNKIILSSAKQCKRSLLPEIRGWVSLETCIENLQKSFQTLCVLDPDAELPLSQIKIEKENTLCVILGSEKGLNAKETSLLASKGARFANMGTSILRAFTAAIAGTSLIVLKRDELKK